ncbi:MAG: arginine--tRNA ligase [Spirochaetales bacterium]|nr:arginine--tRNA ligase [Spirochaetales bacterium]
MKEILTAWRTYVFEALKKAAQRAGIKSDDLRPEQLIIETPPNPELGDLGFPMFPFARHFKSAPAAIALAVKAALEEAATGGDVRAEGPYLNVFLPRAATSERILERILEQKEAYGVSSRLEGQRVMIEFSCPNTNKPLHLGHLRNDAIGISLSNLFKENGAEVLKVNLINDRGIHICKSMIAYQKFGEGKTPESEGVKGDHFVGDYYVKYSSWEKEDPTAEEQARDLLRKWEAGDPETTELWKTMNRWAISGIEETYRRTGVSFDRVYFESETYASGREQVNTGLERKVFKREDDGSVTIDLTDIDLDKRVLLRSDGTSLYVTQDIGTAIQRYRDWPFDRLIYVVASEQEYHFKVLFHILKRLGYEWADNLFHFPYGMVNLPEGRMKSREGTVVDADDLLTMLTQLAEQEIREKGRETEVDDPAATADAIARAAVNYYLLGVSPLKDMIFNPAESIAFNGNTGPYLQYTGARLRSMIRKFESNPAGFAGGKFDPRLIQDGDEWEVIKILGLYPTVIEDAAEDLNPTSLANHLYNLTKVYSRYYHDNPVLHNEKIDLVHTRIAIARAVVQVLKNGFRILGIPFLEKM